MPSVYVAYPNSLHKQPLQDFAFFHTKIVTLSLVTFRMTLMSQKKEEVYNILIINNLYINIYFFCFQFLEKWQVTICLQQPLTRWFSAIYVRKFVTFRCHFSPNCHFLTVTKSVQIGRFGASIVKIAVGVTFAQSDTWESAHFCAIKK